MPSAKPFEIEDPAVFALLQEFDALRTWEVLRRSHTVVTVADLAAMTGFDAKVVRRQLELLAAHGLVTVVRARKPRMTVGYRVAVDRIDVTFDGYEPASVARAAQSAAAVSREFERCLKRYAEPRDQPTDGFRAELHVMEHYTPEDVAELKRRILAVVEFLETPRPIAPGRSARHGRRVTPSRFCNQAIRIELDPLAGDLLPLPSVWMMTRSKFESTREGDADRTGVRELAPREREVAFALAEGLSRAHVAQRMHLSVHTVSTLARRVYRKLAVSSQAELAARLGGHARR